MSTFRSIGAVLPRRVLSEPIRISKVDDDEEYDDELKPPPPGDIDAQVAHELKLSEVVHKAPLNPCDCCRYSREKAARIWSVCNLVPPICNVNFASHRLFLIISSFESGVKDSAYHCKTEPTALAVVLHVFNFLAAIMYFVASVLFVIGAFYSQREHKPLRLRLSKIYKYVCLASVPTWGHVLLYIYDFSNCHTVWQFDTVHILSIVLLAGCTVFGYVMARSFIAWLEVPEIRKSEQLEAQVLHRRWKSKAASSNASVNKSRSTSRRSSNVLGFNSKRGPRSISKTLEAHVRESETIAARKRRRRSLASRSSKSASIG